MKLLITGETAYNSGFIEYRDELGKSLLTLNYARGENGDVLTGVDGETVSLDNLEELEAFGIEYLRVVKNYDITEIDSSVDSHPQE